MTHRYEFSIRNLPKARKPHHFIGSGLPNVYLYNGFKIEKDPDYGQTVSIDKLPHLFMTIAFELVVSPQKLTGDEYRFLRKRMEMTQAAIAKQFRVSEQTVANYEKGKTDAGAADLAIRLLFLAHVADDGDLAQELRFEAEDLMKPSRRENLDQPPRVGPWIASVCT